LFEHYPPTSKNGSEDDDEEEEYELDPEKPKLLIVLGLSLTLPLVLIEIFYDYESSMLIDYILIALASPVQFILGRSFYVRFYMGLRKKRVFTISTLVILSTTVAYSYSVKIPNEFIYLLLFTLVPIFMI
jgi:Cu+-exporting ATPase